MTILSYVRRCPYVATDAVIRHNSGQKTGIVLITRKHAPLGLALPGGFAEYGLSFEENIIKEAKEETGLDFFIDNPRHPFIVQSEPDRDPRAHIGALVYTGIGKGILLAGDDAKSAYLLTPAEILARMDEFAFEDHKDVMREYLQQHALYVERYAAKGEQATTGGKYA